MTSDRDDQSRGDLPSGDDPHARIRAVLAGERAPESLGDLTHEELHFIARQGDEALAAGKVQAALQLFERLVALLPDEFLFQSRLGAARQTAGDLDGALAAYDEALRLNHFDVTSATNRAAILIERGAYDDAARALARIDEIDPTGDHPHTSYAKRLAALLVERTGE